MKKVLCCLLSLLTAISICGCAAGDTLSNYDENKKVEQGVGKIILGGKNIKKYSVVIPEKPTEAEEFAADQLIEYINLATGVKLEKAKSAKNAIYVGGYPDEKLGEEGYVIQMKNGDLIISGNAPRGTLYGVYSFLEDYIGCRWLDYDCEYVKSAKKIEIPKNLNVTKIPEFWFRSSYWYNYLKNPFFAIKNKHNQAISGDFAGNGVDYTGLFVHTFSQIAPLSEYYDEHPEYFTWKRNGDEALPDDNRVTQLCLSNPEVLELAKKWVRGLLEENPDAKLISVSQNDNQNYCKCEKCAAVDKEEGSPAGSLLRFVNAVAEDIEKDYPDVTIDTLAYQYTRKVPAITKPRHNVQIRLCSIECCFMHSLEDGECVKNVDFMRDLFNWSQVCDNLAIWDYTANYNNYSNPHPNLLVLRENMKTFAEHNVKSMFAQGNWNGDDGEFGTLKAYLITKLMWDPYMSEEKYQEYIDDFLKGYYGEAWKTVREYLDLFLEKAEDSDKHAGCFNGSVFFGITAMKLEPIKNRWTQYIAKLPEEQATRLERAFISVLLTEKAYYDSIDSIVCKEQSERIYEQARKLAWKHALAYNETKNMWP